MRPRGLCGCTLLCAAAAAVLVTPLATHAQGTTQPATQPATAPAGMVAAGQPVSPAYRPKPKWSEVCILSIVDGKIVLRSNLSLDVLKSLDGTLMEMPGMPGMTSAAIVGRGQYEIKNLQKIADGELTLNVTSNTRYGLTLMMAWDGPAGVSTITLTQKTDYRRSGSGGEVRLSYDSPAPGSSMSVEATDAAALRKEYPHEANRFLRPLLRKLKADLYQIDPAAARQVLFPLETETSDDVPLPAGGAADVRLVPSLSTRPIDDDLPARPATRPATQPAAATQPAVDPRVAAQVRKLVAELDAPTFARREAAADRLARMGPPAVVVLTAMDKERLTSQQALTIDLLIAQANPLSPDEARRLRWDVHFLLDCLYMPDPDVRAAAAERLTQVAKVAASRFEPALAMDPAKDPDGFGAVAEKLREELAPKAKPPP